jgi:hypothetical protein
VRFFLHLIEAVPDEALYLVYGIVRIGNRLAARDEPDKALAGL